MDAGPVRRLHPAGHPRPAAQPARPTNSSWTSCVEHAENSTHVLNAVSPGLHLRLQLRGPHRRGSICRFSL
ncbi:MAG: hypothetical protein MZV70_00015 [Desulfobacterales bacterium]|nr:hypothetical protein [Desulfobacterales bacterium]